jgi:hypothetical protein
LITGQQVVDDTSQQAHDKAGQPHDRAGDTQQPIKQQRQAELIADDTDIVSP